MVIHKLCINNISYINSLTVFCGECLKCRKKRMFLQNMNHAGNHIAESIFCP